MKKIGNRLAIIGLGIGIASLFVPIAIDIDRDWALVGVGVAIATILLAASPIGRKLDDDLENRIFRTKGGSLRTPDTLIVGEPNILDSENTDADFGGATFLPAGTEMGRILERRLGGPNIDSKDSTVQIEGGYVEDVGFGIRVRGNSKLRMTEPHVHAVGHYLETPKPNGSLAALSNQDLRDRVASLHDRLVLVQHRASVRHRKFYDRYMGIRKDDAFEAENDRNHAVETADFREHQPEAYAVLCELVHRAPPVERYTIDGDERCGFDAIMDGRGSGPRPYGGAAEVLARLAALLDD